MSIDQEKIRSELPKISLGHNPSEKPDELTKQEKEQYQLEAKRKSEELRLANDQQNIELRKSYTQKIFILLCVWLASIFGIILLQGFQSFIGFSFNLSDTVLVALITTTTGNVAIYFLVVTKYLFPKNKSS